MDKRFAVMETEGIDQLRAALEELNSSLSDLVESRVINEEQKGHLLDWTQRVFDKLTVNYKNVTKGVDELMGGYILHTRTDDILDKGRSEGREQGIGIGRKQGRDQRDREKIEEMLRKGKTPEAIADFCDYPLTLVKEVENNMLSLA